MRKSAPVLGSSDYKVPRVRVYDGYTCEPFTQCNNNEYEKEAPTPDKDRVCAPLTQCINGLETKAPTATTDRQCKSVETAKDLETYLVQQALAFKRILTNQPYTFGREGVDEIRGMRKWGENLETARKRCSSSVACKSFSQNPNDWTFYYTTSEQAPCDKNSCDTFRGNYGKNWTSEVKAKPLPANAYVELELNTDHVEYGEDPLKQAGYPQKKNRKFVTQMGRANNRRFYGPNLEYKMRKENRPRRQVCRNAGQA